MSSDIQHSGAPLRHRRGSASAARSRSGSPQGYVVFGTAHVRAEVQDLKDASGGASPDCLT